MATLNYATQYQEALVQKFTKGASFGALYNTPNNSIIKWTGPKTIQIPSIKVGGCTGGSWFIGGVISGVATFSSPPSGAAG